MKNSYIDYREHFCLIDVGQRDGLTSPSIQKLDGAGWRPK